MQGATIGGELLIYDGPAGINQGSPAVTYSPEAGRYFVVWGEDRNDGNAYDLYSRWLAADGSPVTAVLPFSRHPGDQVVASLASDHETQRVLATWWDYRTGDCDIHAQLGSSEYWRLRLGIGHPGVKAEVVDYVLRKPSTEHRELIEQTIERSVDALDLLLAGEMERAMMKVHAKPPRPKAPRPAPAADLVPDDGPAR